MSSFFSGFGRFRERNHEEPFPPAPPSTTESMSETSDDNSSQSSVIKILDSSQLRQGVLSSITSRLKGTLESEFDLRKDCTLDDRIRSLYTDGLEQRCKFNVKDFNRKHGLSGNAVGNVTDGHLQDNENHTETESSSELHASAKTPESVIASLKNGYFQENFDPVQEQIEKLIELPENNPSLSTNEDYVDDGMKDINLLFMIALEDADTDKDMITKRLALLIHKSQPEIAETQNGIFSIDVDIARAATQISLSRRRMDYGKDFISKGIMKIHELFIKKNRLKWLLKYLDDFNSFRQLSTNAKDLAINGDYYAAISTVYELMGTFQDKKYNRFEIIFSIQETLLKTVPIIRKKADKVLESICRRCFDSTQYSNVICTYMIIDFMRDKFGVVISGECEDHEITKSARRKSSVDTEILSSATGGRETSSNDGLSSSGTDSEQCLDRLASHISKYQLQDINNCMKSTIMEYLSPGCDKNGSQHLLTDLDESMELEDLYNLLTPNVTVQCVLRCCELLCEAVHTHYLITQWHRSPFDQSNSKEDYLHRCPAVLSHEEEFFENSSEAEIYFNSEDSSIEECDAMDSAHVADCLRECEGTDCICHDEHDSKNAWLHKWYQPPPDQIVGNEGITEMMRNSYTSESPSDGSNGKMNKSHYPLTINGKYSPPVSSISPTPCIRRFPGSELETSISKRIIGAKKNLNIDMTHLNKEFLGQNSEPIFSRMVSLQQVFSKLYESRVDLWEYVEDSIWLLLKNVIITSNIALEDFLTMSWALNELVTLGFEFCRARSRALIGCITEKSSYYFCQIHKDSFMMLRQVMEAEPWKCLPMDIADLGGVCGIIKMNLSRNQITTSNRQKINVRGLMKSNSRVLVLRSDEVMKDEAGKMRREGGSSKLIKNVLTSFAIDGNPFCIVTASKLQVSGDSSDNNSDNANFFNNLFDDDEIINQDDEKFSIKRGITSVVVTQSSLKGLSNLTGKYLQLMHVIKSLSVDIFRDLCQLFDFYICSVFQGFVPELQRERLLYYTKENAPPPDTAKDFQALKTYTSRAFLSLVPGEDRSDSSIGSSSMRKFADVISVSADSNQFCCRDQADTKSLGVSSALNEHLVAAESCWFAARILKDMQYKILRLLPQSHHIECSQYIDDIQCIVGQLQSLIYRGICPQLCSGNDVVSKIQECSWADARKQIGSGGKANDWVHQLVSNCEEIWEFLNNDSEFSIVHNVARDQAWMELCQAAFDITLDAFSSAKKTKTVVGSNTTSSESCRSAMINDLNFIQDSLDAIRACRPARGKEHVEEFIKATGLNEEDMMQWVRENWQMYAYRHMSALITQTLASVMKKSKLKEALIELDNLYDQDQKFHSSTKEKRRRTVLGIKLPMQKEL